MNNKIQFFGIFVAMFLMLSSSVSAMGHSGPNIVETALAVNAESGEFSILIAALQAADLSIIETLSGRGRFTVFAPTDAAFENLFDELGVTAGDVLANQELLNTVLTYHVARGHRSSLNVIFGNRIRTLQRSFVMTPGSVLVDELGREANIITADISTSNGLIHVIDAVIVPSEAVALI